MKFFLTLAILFLIICASASAGVVTGTIYDSDMKTPVPYASIRVDGTNRSMMANAAGEYRLYIKDGEYNLKFTRVGYYDYPTTVKVVDSVSHDIYMRPSMIIVKSIKAYDRALDPGQKIIVEAIKRKDDILSKLKQYSFDSYSRFVLSKIEKVKEGTTKDSTEIMMIAESQTSGFWEYPDKYKEIINSRKQTANIDPENNLVAIGEILNFNLNRIELDDYSVVSPTAKDALDYYNYYLLDTIYIEGNPAFHLEFEPKNQSAPLFAGYIDIADSTYDVVGVSVTFNEALDFPFIEEIWFTQRYSEFNDLYWMPIEEHIYADLDIPFIGFPDMHLKFTASIYDYKFDISHPKGTFDEFILEVAETADDVDSVDWYSAPTIPLAEEEVKAYEKIDSTENAPKPFYTYILRGLGALLYISSAQYDLFHYNRVEGAYAGIGIKTDDLIDNLSIHARTGYAFGIKRWAHKLGVEYTLSNQPQLNIGLEYHDQVTHKPTIFADEDYNPSFWALMSDIDPFEYYLEKGFTGYVSIAPSRLFEFEIRYNDFKQYSTGVNSHYSLFGDEPAQDNSLIVDGHLRSIGGGLVLDSRPMINNKGEVSRISRLPYIIAKAGMEYSSPDLFDSDFDFRRYYINLNPNYRFLGLGVSELYLYGGMSDNLLPPQKQSTVDYVGEIFPEDISFKTLGRNNFSGNHVFTAYLQHDFGRLLFLKLGLKKLPLSLGVHGGMFMTDWKHPVYKGDYGSILQAKKAFGEAGFSIGRIPPFSMKLYFTWQLSKYRDADIEKFSFDLNLEF